MASERIDSQDGTDALIVSDDGDFREPTSRLDAMSLEPIHDLQGAAHPTARTRFGVAPVTSPWRGSYETIARCAIETAQHDESKSNA